MYLARTLCLLLTAGITAQRTAVSPAGLDLVAGNAPFLNTLFASARYLQIHSDLGPLVLVLRKLGFRQVAGTGNGTGTCAYDLELWFGASRSYDRISWTF